MAIHTDIDLSANDKRILHALFDPETLPSSVAKSNSDSFISSTLPSHPTIPEEQLSILEAQQNELIRRVSSASSPTTEVFEEVLEELNNVIGKWPSYPSVHLNRAMVQRLKLESTGPASNMFNASPDDIAWIFTSLSHAIQLSSPTMYPTVPISTYQARILRLAYAHRAYLHLKAAELGVKLSGKAGSELEELASLDFAAAARFGDEAAREMSVRTNPYAKMCGAIVRNALQEEMKQASC